MVQTLCRLWFSSFMAHLQEGPTLSHVHCTYSQISVTCRFGPNNLMASWGLNEDDFVGFKKGLDIASCRVSTGDG
jgi:hypothetical protein